MTFKKWTLVILAIIGGEISLVLLTTIAQEVLFDGIRYRSSPLFDLVVGGTATFLAAVLAGFIARLIAGAHHLVVPLVISLIVTLETGYLISRQISGDPLWFDVLAGASLIIGIWLGFNYKERKVFGL